jgi:hypothetical protein
MIYAIRITKKIKPLITYMILSIYRSLYRFLMIPDKVRTGIPVRIIDHGDMRHIRMIPQTGVLYLPTLFLTLDRDAEIT